MAAENAVFNAIKALRPLRNEVDNFFLFEEEVKAALASVIEKQCRPKLFETSKNVSDSSISSPRGRSQDLAKDAP